MSLFPPGWFRPPIWRRNFPSRENFKTILSTGPSGEPPLGLLPGMRYASERHCFTPGTRLLFYTDGLTEVFRGDEEFGPERLMDQFCKCSAQKADGILDALWGALDAFSEGGPQGDDMTALTLCRGSKVAEIPA